jgi:hypothetical protein
VNEFFCDARHTKIGYLWNMQTPTSPETLARGRRLLKSLLPKAKAMVRNGENAGTLEARSALARSAMAHINEKNLDALMIYEMPTGSGCWHADIILKKVNAGVSNSFGSPASSPLFSREEAIQFGVDLLATIIGSDFAAKNAKAAQKDVRAFLLHGVEFEIPGKILDELSMVPELLNNYGSELAARNRLDEVIRTFMPEGLSKEAFDALPLESQLRVISVIGLCMLSGINRHPDTISGRRH